MRVLLVGARVLPFRHSGDKNFWLDMFHGLRDRGHEIDILSVTVEDVPDGGLPLHRVPPIPMYLRPDRRFNPEYRHIAGTNNYVSKTISLPRIVRELRRRRIAFRPDLIHFIDNFGPATVGLRSALRKIPMTISAPTYQPDRPLYDLLLQASFASFDVVVPFSDAYADRLRALSFPDHRVRRIRWGVDTRRFVPPAADQKAAARTALGLPPAALGVLWTGFIQQTGERDLRLALRAAELALERDPTAYAFLFCFKPVHFKESYRSFERPGLRVLGSADQFQAARTAADVLLSPIEDLRTTAAPPLAWLECLAMGLPIVTTEILGGGEAIVPGESGFMVRSPDEGAERLREIAVDPALRRHLRDGARRIAEERYAVDRAVTEYLDLWSSTANGRL